MLSMRFEPRGGWQLQYCAKVTQTNFDGCPGFLRKFRCERTFRERNYEQYFAVDASGLQTQEGKFTLLESLVRNFERKFAIPITAKCSPCIVVMHCKKFEISVIHSSNHSIAPSCWNLNECSIVDVIRTARCSSLSRNDHANTPGKWNLNWAPFVVNNFVI